MEPRYCQCPCKRQLEYNGGPIINFLRRKWYDPNKCRRRAEMAGTRVYDEYIPEANCLQDYLSSPNWPAAVRILRRSL